MRHNQLAPSPLLVLSCGGHVQSVDDQRGCVACLSTHRVICCGLRVSAPDFWHLLCGASCPDQSGPPPLLPCLCCPCGQLWPLASPSLPSGHEEQLCSFKEPGMMESGCPSPVLWHTEGVTRSLGMGSIFFSRCLVPGTCQVWLRVCFSKDQVRCGG